jgi:succinate-semialdehyde dehydrogenase / glutarate-semialdehyde dehydrogenase
VPGTKRKYMRFGLEVKCRYYQNQEWRNDIMAIESINPATGEKLDAFDEMPRKEVHEILEQVQHTWSTWRATDVTTRAESMRKAAQVLRDNQDAYARLMAQEMGKPIRQGRPEIEKCAWVCEYYADSAERFLAPEVVETEASRSYVAFEPLGVILAVMPWNFPFWQVFRFAAPCLMAGNGAVLKHASNVPGCALAIEDIFLQAGFPENLFRTLLIGSSMVDTVLESPVIKGVALTGSTPAGQAVAARAGSLLKKTVLELGGSDPYLILEDADLEQASTECVESRLLNSGQSCINAKRFIVVDAVRERFEALFVGKMRQQRIGDPLDTDTDVGPLARQDLRAEVHRQVKGSIEKGARVLLGGEIPAGTGSFYAPTVLTNVKQGMPAYDEEIFGPVAAIIPVKDEAEAIRVANDSPFGLGAAVFTSDLDRGERIAAKELEAGSCFVNAFVRSDPRLPFGGIKDSGYGRELGKFGIRQFVNIKTIYIR